MRKLLVLCLCLFVSVSLSACSQKEETKDAVSSESNDVANDVANVEDDVNETTQEEANPVTAFSCVDIDGNDITSSVYGDYDLTLINIFATWCPPCIAELPELAALYDDVESEGVNFIAFVIDTVGMYGGVDEEAVETAIYLRDNAGAKFKMIIPDETFMNGLRNVQTVPTTFFVDKNGNIVGDAIVGANNYDAWNQIIKERLSAL